MAYFEEHARPEPGRGGAGIAEAVAEQGQQENQKENEQGKEERKRSRICEGKTSRECHHQL